MIPFQQITQIFSKFLNAFNSLMDRFRINVAVLTEFAVDVMSPGINDDLTDCGKVFFEFFLNVFHTVFVRNGSSACGNVNEHIFRRNILLQEMQVGQIKFIRKGKSAILFKLSEMFNYGNAA